MDFFGYSIGPELSMGKSDWLESLELGKSEDFDPEGEMWDLIFTKFANCLNQAKLPPKVGGCLHLSHSVSNQIADTSLFNILPKYTAACEKFKQQIGFELGVHMTIIDANPLGKQFRSLFDEDMTNAHKLGATTMVIHPQQNFSYNQEKILRLFGDRIVAPEICAKLRETKIILAWENTFDGQYASLEQLVRFRDHLCDRLKETGNQDLIPQHRFCLDTGHLCVWRAPFMTNQLAQQEIDTFLPQFAKDIKVFHIHANDGNKDFHITPRSTALLEHKTRQGLDLDRFQINSKQVEEWIQICNQHAAVSNRHFQLEIDPPFTYDQVIEWGTIFKTL